MPTNERFRYAYRVSFAQFAGFAIGVMLWIGIEIALNPQSFTDSGKFTPETLIAIYAVFILITGLLSVFGAFFAAFFTPVVPRAKRFWWAAFLLGGVNASGMIGVTYLYEVQLFSQYGFGALVAAGLLTTLFLKPAGLTFGIARRWYAPGLCQSCGYDLRRTPVGKGCPECGEVAVGDD